MKECISKSNDNSKKRIEWIDALRALAVFWVVLGHILSESPEFYVFTSPIKITLFFAITGFVFNKEAKTNVFFIKLFRNLIVPWLVLSIVPYCILIPIKGFENMLLHTRNILVGKENWYMPCCIIAEVLWYFIIKYIKRIWIISIICISCFFAGIIMYQYNILNVFMINRSFTVLLFIFGGYLLKRYNDKLNGKRVDLISITLGILYIVLGIISLKFYPGKNMDVHRNYYYNYLICLLMISFGIFFLYYWARNIKKYPKILLLIGKNTLVIYLFHGYIVAIVSKLLRVTKLYYQSLVMNILIAIISCIICTFLSILINYLFPVIMGKKRTAFKKMIRS